MYAQAPGAMLGGQIPAELAQQQERWEKERIETEKKGYQQQLTHMALMLLSGASGDRYDISSALKSAHELMQGAKTYNP